MTGAPDIRIERADAKPWGPLSPFHHRSILFEGVSFPSAEHAFQAGKPKRREVRDWLLAAPSTALLTTASQNLPTWEIASGWSRSVRDRMRSVLRAKFEQHADLRDLLHATGDARIVLVLGMDNAVNRFWGEVNGEGDNFVGRCLVDLRDGPEIMITRTKARIAAEISFENEREQP